MGLFFVEHAELIVGFMALIMSILAFFIRRWIREVDIMREKVNEMKDNYLARFEDLKAHNVEENKETRSMMAEIMIKLSDIQGSVQMQANLYELLQKRLDEKA